MTQRNFQNQRYKDDDRKGASRKSAAKAKPKTQAASSVQIATPQQKAKARKQQNKIAERKYRAEENARLSLSQESLKQRKDYKFWRRLWAILLGLAVLFVILSILIQQVELPFLGDNKVTLVYVFMGAGYVGIFASLGIEFIKVKKIRTDEASKIKLSKEELSSIDKMAEREAARPSFFQRTFGKNKQN